MEESLGITMNRTANGSYAEVNGLRLYHEIHQPVGEADSNSAPLILLHGGIGSVEMFTPSLQVLTQRRMVITVDLQGHGRTADIDRPIRYELMADDIAELIKLLRIKQADIMGYSLGGGVSLRTAIQHPALVRKVIVVSAPFKQSGWYPEILAAATRKGPEAVESKKKLPLYRVYAGIAPRPDDWPILLAKLGDLVSRNYDWMQEAAAMKAPAMIVVGDADAVRTSHSVECFELLGGGQRDAGWDGSGSPVAQLAILPGTTHYNIISTSTLARAVVPFLDAPMPQSGQLKK